MASWSMYITEIPNFNTVLTLLSSLVTKLAKDLEGEFYPYYTRMLSCALPLVYHQDIKLLEVCFMQHRKKKRRHTNIFSNRVSSIALLIFSNSSHDKFSQT